MKTTSTTTLPQYSQSSLSRRLTVQRRQRQRQRQRQQQQPIVFKTIIFTTIIVIISSLLLITTTTQNPCFATSLSLPTTTTRRHQQLLSPKPPLLPPTKPTTTTTAATPNNLHLITRRIQKCGTNYQLALSLLSTIPPTTNNHTNKDVENAHIATLSTLVHQPSLAIQLYHNHPTERCRAATISICGKNDLLSEAWELLRRAPPPGVASYNALLAAAGRKGDWEMTLVAFRTMPRGLISRVTCHAVLTALAKSRRGIEARSILKRMEEEGYFPNVAPDETSYRLTARALVRMGRPDEAEELLLPRWETEETYNVLTSSYGKVGRWEDVARLERRRRRAGGTVTAAATTTAGDETTGSRYFDHWNRGMIKRGKGSSAYWELGRYTFHESSRRDVIVALQPHRNPTQNGIKMLFFYDVDDESSSRRLPSTTNDTTTTKNDVTSKRERIGYLLMINRRSPQHPSKDTSTLLGLYISPPHRQKKLSSLFLALWCHLCLQSQTIIPQTGIINKPLLAMVLQHRLGFLPSKGTTVEIYKNGDDDSKINESNEEEEDDDDGRIYLYSSTAKSLEGVFGPWDVKRQNIVLMTRRPPTTTDDRGRMVTLRTRFRSPADDDDDRRREWIRMIRDIVTSRGRFHFDWGGDDGKLLRRVLLGR